MSTALLARRKSSSASATTSYDDEGVYERRPSSLSLSVEERRCQQEHSSISMTSPATSRASNSTSSILSTLLSPLSILMDISAPSAARRGSKVDNVATSSTRTTTTSKVVAEECSSDDGSLSAEDDDEIEEDEQDEYDDVRLVDADAADEEENVSSSNSSSKKQSSQLVVVDKPGFRKRLALIRFKHHQQPMRVNVVNVNNKEIDVQAYMSKREMTVTQERWNAITVIPNPIFCLYFLLGGLWVSNDLVHQARLEYSESSYSSSSTDYAVGGASASASSIGGFGGFLNDMLGDEHGCLNNPTAASSSSSSSHWWWWWQGAMPPALPPLPAMAVALGITLHAPWSVLYHWKYAHALPAGAPRTNHWSRRMDQSMIHVASAIIAYGTSGSWDFFMANVFYNLDCVYRQLHEAKVRPRRNKVRLLISVIAYTLPIIWHEGHDNWALFGQLWLVLLIGFWLFGLYPIGGWSHCVFHLVAMLLPPLLMKAACRLPVAQEQMKLAAQCVVLAEQRAAAQ